MVGEYYEMNEYPVTEYKGYSLRPVIKISDEKIDDTGVWYEYSIEGWLGKRRRLVKGAGVYQTPDSAAKAAVSFAKNQIDEHLIKYKNSFFYRMFCSLGYCPASRYG